MFGRSRLEKRCLEQRQRHCAMVAGRRSHSDSRRRLGPMCSRRQGLLLLANTRQEGYPVSDIAAAL